MKCFKSLSSRLKLLTLLWVTAAVGSIVLTLLLSWRLEGGAAAINDAGSLRMQTYRLGLLLRETDNQAEVDDRIRHFDETLYTLQAGDPARPLFLPDTPEVRQHMAQLQQRWQQQIKPMMLAATRQPSAFQDAPLHDFVRSIDDLVRSVEAVNTRHTYWLRLFQSALLAMVLLGAGVMVVVLYLWIIRPLDNLQSGMRAIHDGDLGAQISVDQLEEFAQLDSGFNQMSSRLKRLYSHLEQEVAEKTRDLADKNYTLETLYSFSRLLNQTQTAADAATAFLQKVMQLIPAPAGSIRLLDFKRRRMDLVAHQGLSENLQNADACQRLEDCFCGRTVNQQDWQPIYFQDQLPETELALETPCEQSGFHYLHIFNIRYNQQDLGILTLYFEQEYPLDTQTKHLLDSLSKLMGLVLTNIRLAEESRQLAVMQERNLMAQGLHDSIAQTLTFLNLQVQMLESALAAHQQEQADENLQFIKEGVQECYDDVRELLLNFRTKISRKEYAEAVQTLVERFEQQTQVRTDVQWQGDGPALGSEEQLQFIFILQESLSNIRKHAKASKVQIVFDNRKDFMMQITDDGQGFSTTDLSKRSGSHVGLNIMHERALRIHAHLDLASRPGCTQITLTLPQQERILI